MFLLKKVFQLRDKANPDNEKPFLEHLEDLRVMITRSLVVLMVSMVGCFMFQDTLMEILRKPIDEVQEIHSTKLLPATITPTQWEDAKKVEFASLSFEPERRAIYFAEFDADTLHRVELVRLLRAIASFPGKKDDAERIKKQEAFLKKISAQPGDLTMVMDMLAKGASPNLDERGNLKMLSTLTPTESFMLSMKLAFFAGVVVSFPFLLLFILQFVLPGLHSHEQKVLWPALAIGFGLFLFGVFFAYMFVLPRALTFFYEWSTQMGVSNDWRIGEYVTFATQFTLLFGLSFELPVVVMVFVKIGLLSYETMRKTRSYAILAIFVAAAIITPTPDAFTLCLMAGPMCVLYELCIWLAYFDDKKKAQREAEEEKQRNEEDRLRLERLLKDEKEREEEEAKTSGSSGSGSGLASDSVPTIVAAAGTIPTAASTPDLHEPEGEEGEDKSDHQHEPWDPSSLEEGWLAGKESEKEAAELHAAGDEAAAEKPSVVTDHLPEESQEVLDDTPPESIPGEEVRRMRDLSGGDEPEKK